MRRIAPHAALAASASHPIEAQAGPAIAYAPKEALAARLLDDDEIVILALKPSPWFVLIHSFRWLVGLAAVAWLFLWFPQSSLATSLRIQLVAIAGCLVVGVTALQWVSRLYVLTNRRIMRIRGILRVEIIQAPLIRVAKASLTASIYERFFRLGTLHLHTPELDPTRMSWQQIARPDEVHRIVSETIDRARHQNAMRNL